jgi:hypothetical protein
MPRTRGHLEVDVHAVVRQHDDDLRAGGAGFVDRLLHVLFLDAEAPVRRLPARVGDRRVGEGLADDGDRHAVHVLHHEGLEHGSPKSVVLTFWATISMWPAKSFSSISLTRPRRRSIPSAGS